MGSRPEYEEAKQIEDLDRRASRPRLLYVSLAWEVWARSEHDPDEPDLLEVVHDLHALIDRQTGGRIVVRDGELDGDNEFLDLAASAEQVPLVYSVTEPQLAVVRDEDHRVVAAFGGEGGGKTQALGLWTVRTWLRVGGRGNLLWWVAPSLEQTRIGVEKLVTGEADRAPLLPETLVLSWPETTTSRDQEITMVDGTRIQLRYAATGGRKGGQFKGRRPRAIGIDEACEIKPVRIWKLLLGRLTRARHRAGDVETPQLFLSSTPEEGHWAEREIVAPVDAGNEPAYTYRNMTQRDNPWVKTRDIESAIKAKGGPDDPQCQRDVFGLWVASTGRAYYRFDLRRHVRRFGSLEDLGLVDVTDAVIRERWSRLPEGVTTALVGGQDFNVGYCMTVVAKLGVPKSRPYQSFADLVVVVVAEHRSRFTGYEAHGYQLRERFGRIPIACDATGAQVDGRVEPGNRQATTHAKRLARAGHDVRPCWITPAGAPQNPSVSESLEQVNELLAMDVDGIPKLIVSADCAELLDSMQNVKRTDDDQIDKVAGKKSDQQSGAGDAVRYLLAFHFPDQLKAQ